MPQLMIWLATAVPIPDAPWGEVFKTYGPTGVLALIAVFLVVQYIPKVHREHLADINNIHKAHEESTTQLTAGFVAELKAERESRERTTGELRDAIDELKDCIKQELKVKGGQS